MSEKYTRSYLFLLKDNNKFLANMFAKNEKIFEFFIPEVLTMFGGFEASFAKLDKKELTIATLSHHYPYINNPDMLPVETISKSEIHNKLSNDNSLDQDTVKVYFESNPEQIQVANCRNMFLTSGMSSDIYKFFCTSDGKYTAKDKVEYIRQRYTTAYGDGNKNDEQKKREFLDKLLLRLSSFDEKILFNDLSLIENKAKLADEIKIWNTGGGRTAKVISILLGQENYNGTVGGFIVLLKNYIDKSFQKSDCEEIAGKERCYLDSLIERYRRITNNKKCSKEQDYFTYFLSRVLSKFKSNQSNQFNYFDSLLKLKEESNKPLNTAIVNLIQEFEGNQQIEGYNVRPKNIIGFREFAKYCEKNELTDDVNEFYNYAFEYSKEQYDKEDGNRIGLKKLFVFLLDKGFGSNDCLEIEKTISKRKLEKAKIGYIPLNFYHREPCSFGKSMPEVQLILED